MATTLNDARDAPQHRSERYWFPRRLIRFFFLLPDPLPLQDRFTYVRTSPLTPRRCDELEREGSALEIPGRSWLDNLDFERTSAPTIEDFGDAAEHEEPRGATSLPSRQKFLSVVRIWNGQMNDLRQFQQMEAALNAQLRLRDRQSRHQSSSGEGGRSTTLAVQTDYSVAEVVVPLFERPEIDPQKEREWSMMYALDSVRHI